MNLEHIPGIGEKIINEFKKIDIFTVNDLIEYLPYKYNFYCPQDINQSQPEQFNRLTINGVIDSVPKIVYIKRNFNYLTFRLLTSNKLINVILFNRGYLKNKLIVGKEICITGRYDKNKNTFSVNNILLEPLKKEVIEPVYHPIGSIKNKSINKLINKALSYCKIKNTLPDYITTKYKFISERDALIEIHNPKDIKKLKQAKLVFIYKEFFEFMLKINYLKIKRNENVVLNKRKLDMDIFNKTIASLPFQLTKDQTKAINDILEDFGSSKVMNRIIVGDVGSGKTIVAFLAIYANYLTGFQSAFLAPTEILVYQHFENMKKLFKDIKVEILTSSTSKSKRRQLINDLKENKIDCIIGTHSIINEEVIFNKLGLIITDEQHRFGVKQRHNLQAKGENANVLYMSATPIPRTYALTIFGDMDISEIKTKPSGRKEIKTKLYKENEIKECLEIMLSELKKGHQIYVVSSLVDDKNESNLYDVNKLKEKLNLAFNNKIQIDIIHGKLKNKDKEIIMNNFKNGDTKVLIATTVVEVGVDVKNATCIVIFNAERFGLSTLHQLRGRVGRNDLDSYCLLISNYDIDRLKILETSNDGFYISEKDFELRGSGNLFGTKQSGELKFKMADIKRDFNILKQANKDSIDFLNNGIQEDYYINLLKSVSITN